jgi:thymidine kinase
MEITDSKTEEAELSNLMMEITNKTQQMQTSQQSELSNYKRTGTIKIIIGCMYAGKTSRVITEYKKWESISRKAVCINFVGDTRYGSDAQLYSHDLHKVECVKVNMLNQVNYEDIKDADIILINEGQFFLDLIEYCLLWCEKYGKNIIVSGLDGDFQRKPFGPLLDLIPYSDSVEKINAFCTICKNGTEASFTCRLTQETEQVVIGSDNYAALCRYHYLEKTGGKSVQL